MLCRRRRRFQKHEQSSYMLLVFLIHASSADFVVLSLHSCEVIACPILLRLPVSRVCVGGHVASLPVLCEVYLGDLDLATMLSTC
jgi:hypothetical protein